MYDKKGKIDNNEEELVTIGAFVNFINNSYKLYKKHQIIKNHNKKLYVCLIKNLNNF